MMIRLPVFFQIAILMTLILAVDVSAQKPTGSISGRVVSDDGQPLPNARITLVGSGGVTGNLQARSMITPDEEGNFRVDGLDARPYKLFAFAPGYVPVDPENFPSSPVMGTVSAASYRIGDTVTLTLTRGAVITGRVLTAAGEPIVGISVRTLRIRDHAGRPAIADPGAAGATRKTDDRGIYRIYGLAAGAYVVVAGGGAVSGIQNPYDVKSPIYHPSSTRETAAEITVQNGEEMSGVDIRYRSERGFVISGGVTGPAGASGTSRIAMSVIYVSLKRSGTGELVAQTVIQPNAQQNGFAFYGVPSGEYEVEASRSGIPDVDPMISEPRRVSITVANVSGINITLINAPSIAGTMVIEKSAERENASCRALRDYSIEEAQLLAVRNETGEADQNRETLLSQSNAPSPDAKGEFTILNLRADHYRLRVSLPSDGLYLKSMTFEKADRHPDRDGIILKARERVTGLKVTVAEGAASFSGKVGEGTANGMHVHLVPQEAEAKDDVLRYYEVPIEGMNFKFTNLAPGKYKMVLKPGVRVPLAWNPTERAVLRKMAESSGRPVDLSPCQRLMN